MYYGLLIVYRLLNYNRDLNVSLYRDLDSLLHWDNLFDLDNTVD